ncbi:MAG: hypothetical protein C0481_01985 [Phenylobacterium sp.]|uniref:hypothetical protein n=1 Tax=Phenylobacterium sp. TaxID=1871053 RepID=UPI0025E907AA|nr:hypothetical protein [Phenylobacterium sp.]MBA4010614.1 hypothetical protein [Phenylobacterium sp.]
MGFALDMASVDGLNKDEALRRLGYVDTGRKTDRIGSDVAWAASKGRVVLVTRYGWLGPARLAELSGGASLVAGRFETRVGESHAWGYRNGVRIWSVLRTEERLYDDQYGLTVDGAPPPEFAVIRDRLLAERRAEIHEGDEPDEDLFDLPEALVDALGGWTPEGEGSEDLQFFVAAADGTAEPRYSGFISRLLKVFGRSR